MYSLSSLTRNLELPDPKRANFALRSEEVAEGVVYELAGETLAKVGLPTFWPYFQNILLNLEIDLIKNEFLQFFE